MRKLGLCLPIALIAVTIGTGITGITGATTATAAVTPGPSHPGSWTVTANCPGINPIHVAVTRTGKVLMVAGSGYNRQNFELKVSKAWIYDPATPGACPAEIPLPTNDLFCSGHTHLPDGRILFYGGTSKYGEPGSYLGSPNYYAGHREAYAFDDTTNTFERLPSMNAARWYGQGTADANGNVVVVSGLDENARFTPINERFNAATNTWTKLLTPTWAFPMYAGMVLLPNGQFAYTGTYFGIRNGRQPMTWNPATNAYTGIPGLYALDCRDQGSTVTLYPKVYVIAGGCAPTSGTGTVGVMDMSKSPLSFTSGPYLGYAAQHICATPLPDRSLFVSGGSDHNTAPRLEARRLGPAATAWQTLAKPTVPRGYHSTCIPLLDGRILTMGTNWKDGRVETRLEVYNPWYTQSGFVRARITGLDGTTVPLGGTINATYEVATITGATLTSLPSSTHAAPEGRTAPVSVVAGGFGKTAVRIPASGTVTPPGYYMLSLYDWRGAPSISRIIRITPVGAATVQASVSTGPASASLSVGGSAPAAAGPCCCC
jgi:Galactose oxidase-like, Early set domain/Galactose oxidase, central domain